MTVDFYIYALVCIALALSLMINVIVFILWLGRKYPNLIYKED